MMCQKTCLSRATHVTHLHEAGHMVVGVRHGLQKNVLLGRSRKLLCALNKSELLGFSKSALLELHNSSVLSSVAERSTSVRWRGRGGSSRQALTRSSVVAVAGAGSAALQRSAVMQLATLCGCVRTPLARCSTHSYA